MEAGLSGVTGQLVQRLVEVAVSPVYAAVTAPPLCMVVQSAMATWLRVQVAMSMLVKVIGSIVVH